MIKQTDIRARCTGTILNITAGGRAEISLLLSFRGSNTSALLSLATRQCILQVEQVVREPQIEGLLAKTWPIARMFHSLFHRRHKDMAGRLSWLVLIIGKKRLNSRCELRKDGRSTRLTMLRSEGPASLNSHLFLPGGVIDFCPQLSVQAHVQAAM